MSLDSLFFDWMEFLQIQKGHRPRGVLQYERVIRSFFHWLEGQGKEINPGRVTREVIGEWLRDLFYEQGNISNRSRASKLSALRSFFGYLKYVGLIAADPTKGIPSPKIQPSLPQKFSTEELRMLFSAPARDTTQGLRDLAILKTLYASGLRVSELVSLDCAHLVDTGGYIRLQVMDGNAKGGKGRTLTLRTNPSKTLREWLLLRREMGVADDALFVALRAGRGRRLSERSILNVIKKYAATVGIDRADAFCHKMRSTFATDLYDSGHDKCSRCGHPVQYVGLIELAVLMGHEDVKTTMGYVAISERTLRRTAIPDKRFNEIEQED
jgi:site-specific recombinase XerD